MALLARQQQWFFELEDVHGGDNSTVDEDILDADDDGPMGPKGDTGPAGPPGPPATMSPTSSLRAT